MHAAGTDRRSGRAAATGSRTGLPQGALFAAPGLVHLYTGPGKGKTTAAWGLALRALGHGKRVKVIEFIKGPRLTGEHLAAERFGDLLSVEISGAGFCRKADARHRRAARLGMDRVKQALSSGTWDVVILDEVATAASLGLINVHRLLRRIKLRAYGVEVVMTGRGAPPVLCRAADYATEMRLLRHPYKKGVLARKGIEF